MNQNETELLQIAEALNEVKQAKARITEVLRSLEKAGDMLEGALGPVDRQKEVNIVDNEGHTVRTLSFEVDTLEHTDSNPTEN